MENLYTVLGCDHSASYEQLKKAYQNLALKYHPDKNTELLGHPGDHEMFIKISEAWRILGDSDLRSHFDMRWRERNLTQDWPVQDDIEIDQFLPGDIDLEMFSYPCRCGGQYVLESKDVTLRLDIVCCDTCSLCVTVNYPQS